MEKKEKDTGIGCIVSIFGGSVCLLLLIMKFFGVDISWFGIIIFVIIAFVGALMSQSANVSNQNESFKKQGLDPKNFISSGKYLSGHPNIDKIIDQTFIYPKENVIKIYSFNVNNGLKDFIGNINTKDIVNISLEDETTISKRVGLKRLLALGIFAFALKKKEKIELSYLVIEWKDEGFIHETVFEFEGKQSIQNGNVLRNQLIRVLKNK